MKTVNIQKIIQPCVVICLFFSGCANTIHLQPNQACVSVNRLVGPPELQLARSCQPESRTYSEELIVPAGKIAVAILPFYPQNTMLGVIPQMIGEGIAKKHIRTLEFNALAGHHYKVSLDSKPLFKLAWLRGVIVKDASDGGVVVKLPPL